jgi:hypothetical protein
MRRLDALEYPEDVERVYRVARRWQWVTLAYISSAAVLLYLTMGTSQAMRSSFYEDVISLVPSAAFLIGTAIARRAPTRTYPFGRIGRPRSRISWPRWRCAEWACSSLGRRP